MASSGPLGPRIVELVSLFNAQKSDLPAAVVHNTCVFRLNGRAYHEHLGRPATDPLVRLIGCGPAGYRFLLTALRYAMTGPRLTLDQGTLDEQTSGKEHVISVRAVLSGMLRGEQEPFVAAGLITARAEADGQLRELAVMLGDADVERLLAARRR